MPQLCYNKKTYYRSKIKAKDRKLHAGKHMKESFSFCKTLFGKRMGIDPRSGETRPTSRNCYTVFSTVAFSGFQSLVKILCVRVPCDVEHGRLHEPAQQHAQRC